MSMALLGSVCFGVCPSHKNPTPYTATFVTADPVVVGAVGVGAVAVSSCGHPAVLITGSPITMVTGHPLGRIGDTGTNGGTCSVLTGSPIVTVK